MPHCPQCGNVIRAQTVQQIADQLMELEPATRPGVIGTMVIDGRATEVLDVEAMLHLAGTAVPASGGVRA